MTPRAAIVPIPIDFRHFFPVAAPGLNGPVKYHSIGQTLPGLSMRQVLEGVRLAAGLPPPDPRHGALWDRIEGPLPPALVANSLQIRLPTATTGGDLRPKAYFRLTQPADPLGLRRASLVLGRALAPLDPRLAEQVRHEVLRRSDIEPLSLVGIAVREAIEVEFYLDAEVRGGAYRPDDIRRIVGPLGVRETLIERARACALRAERANLLFHALSADYRPGTRDVMISLSFGPREGSPDRRRDVLAFARDVLDLPGAKNPRPERASDNTLFKALDVSCASIKLATTTDGETDLTLEIGEAAPDYRGFV